MAQPPPQVLELVQRFDRIRAGKYRYRLIYQYMEKVPIRPINADNAADKSRGDQVAQLAERMLALHQRLSAARTPQERSAHPPRRERRAIANPKHHCA